MINRSVRAVSPSLEREIQQCRKIKSLRCGVLRHSSCVYPFWEVREVSEMKIKGTEKLRGIERRQKRWMIMSRLVL